MVVVMVVVAVVVVVVVVVCTMRRYFNNVELAALDRTTMTKKPTLSACRYFDNNEEQTVCNQRLNRGD